VTHLAGYAPQLFSGAGLQSKLSFGNIRVYCSIVPCSIKNRCKLAPNSRNISAGANLSSK